MKKIFKIFSVCVVLAMMMLGLVACSNIKTTSSQIAALLEVSAYKSDMAIIDSTMAGYMLNQSDYSDLRIVTFDEAPESNEFYGVAAYKENLQLIDEVNSRLATASTDGIMAEVADDYGLTDRLIDIEYTSNGATDSSFDDLGDTITIAYTVNPPMGILDSTTDYVSGFDIDLARAIFPEFTIETKLIEWDNKVTELSSDKVDLVWNGLTITEERQETMAISEAYMTNEQAFVVHKDNVDAFEFCDLVDIKIAVEAESAGASYAEEVIDYINSNECTCC